MRTEMKFLAAALGLVLLLAAGCGRSPYDNPIANNSQQPDKILFDKSIENIEKHKYELARITLQTLINTYPDSEYIAKAKLAIADSWYREGTSSALAQAEAEYKDFITFFPNMEEAAESQLKICQITTTNCRSPTATTATPSAPIRSAGNCCCAIPTACSGKIPSSFCAMSRN